MHGLVFRVDASRNIGTGHVMRCLTLADAARQLGLRSTFVCRAHPGHLNDYIARERGFDVVPLAAPADARDPGEDHAAWLGASWQADAAETREVLAGLGGDRPTLVVDHYALDARWEREVAADVERLLVIDDLADRPHHADFLLDQNLGAADYAGLVPAGCQVLRGPRFALVGPAFQQARAALAAPRAEARRVLLFFGGVDASNQTLKALDALAPLAGRVAIDVVVGRAHPARASVEARAATLPGCTVHGPVPHLADLLAAADVFVGAGGTTHWERTCLGVPGVVVTVAANQEPATRALAEAGCLLYLGPHTAVTGEQLRQAVGLLVENAWLRLAMRAACLPLVDGAGAARVARHLLPAVALRPATAADGEALHAWRNASENRRFSLDPAPIPWERHVAWFAESLATPFRQLLIGSLDGAPVGVLRYDLDGPEAVVSVYLVPGQHGQGLGARLLVAGTRWLAETHPEIGRIRAEILAANEASRGAFAGAGYQAHALVYEKEVCREPRA